MIIELFSTLLLLSFALLFLGHFTSDRVYAIIGLTFIFLLGVVLVSGNLEVETGVSIVQSWTTSTVTYTHAPFSDSTSHWFGWLLTVGGFVGVIFLFLGNFGRKDLSPVERRERD